ncbi:ORF76 [Agrotis segetum granulovirus]|uniref:Lef-5 n=1 Tax=Agrotis segetum granulosis virus TaxID=10464 RepID=Q6QXN7_GVAS|nr:lef-5 [Agrotis segetum granulovirus]AAS82662.1 ORF76 [Agrotis segetum granulovirus]AHN92128.1 lef-5 [Agrotis segetum granulovirus]AKN63365.1 lef-5 [Agrotis segetum granulovirus]
MSLNGGPLIAQNDPLHLRKIFDIFADFRRREDYSGLVEHLITTYPENVKNRTFNFSNTGHTFHMLYAYVPSLSNKERKQIRLDGIKKLMKSTSNLFAMYEDVFKCMKEGLIEESCPCVAIKSRLQENIAYNEWLSNKNFDSKPLKLKKDPIDNILFKYSVNWKQSLKKKKNVAVKNEVKIKKCEVIKKELLCFTTLAKKLSPSSLDEINGRTVVTCSHEFTIQEKQLRAGDEAVSFVNVCSVCGLVKKEEN